MADTDLPEEWRIIQAFPDYAVSNLGRVKRLTYKKASPAKAGRILSGTPIKDGGYLVVILCSPSRKRWVKVHVLVCEAFIGPRPSKAHQAAHWDGNPANNALSNLRWATNKENMQDAIRHGRTNRGRHWRVVDGAVTDASKLTEYDVRNIRLAEGRTKASLAIEFGVSEGMIRAIKTRRTWSWVE